MIVAWDTYQTGDVPRMLDTQMSAALVLLVAAVDGRQPAEARQAAIDVARAGLDLELRHRPVVEIDLARFDLWARQIQVDVATRDPGAVTGDVATLEWTWERLRHALDDSAVMRIESELRKLRAAADAENLSKAKDAATRLRGTLGGLEL